MTHDPRDPVGIVKHEDGTIDTSPCCDCWEPTLSILEVANERGDVQFALFMCRPCQAKNKGEAAKLRVVFDGYLADGMTKAEANEAMSRLGRAERPS